MKHIPTLLLFAGFASAAEIPLVDAAGRTSWLHTPTDAPAAGKTYWLAIGTDGPEGKSAGGIASWAQDDVIVLGPTFADGGYDPAQVEELIAKVAAKWPVHPKVFVHGYSNGTDFAQRLAMAEPGRIAGLSLASAGMWPEINPAARGIPFAISCGEYERGKAFKEAPLGKLDGMKRIAAELEKQHFDIEARVIEGGNSKEQHPEALVLARSCFARARAVNFSRTAYLALDFNGSDPLWKLTGAASGEAVTATAKWDFQAGGIEQAGTAQRTGGLVLEASSGPATPEWCGSLDSGLLPVSCPESDLKKLSVSFDLAASTARPVRVTLESYTADGQRSGGLTGLAHPAAADFLHRHSLDLGTMTASGEGAFNAADPLVKIRFSIGSDLGWSASSGHRLRIDNLGMAAPAIYVSPGGDDKNAGSLEKPFATVQKAVNAAKPGDVILVMDGTYESASHVAHIRKPSVPAAWLTLRAHPGHRPVFRSTFWDCIKIGEGSKTEPSTAPAPAYVELRGLTVRGYSKEVEEKYKDKIGKPMPETNGNGIAVDGRFQVNKPHHVRVANCEVYECAGGGISCIQSDRLIVENNHTHDNCHWMIYAGSGITIWQAFCFENTPGEYRMLLRNNRTHDNFCTQPWGVTGKLSDGNGLIIDDFRNTQGDSPNGIYHGRTLVQGNVSYRNGGSGMHAYSSDHVDFINNTAVGNNTVLDYTQIGITRCTDCRIVNNIMVAPADKPVSRVNGGSHDIVFARNLAWGGNGTALPGGPWINADPVFADAKAADFRLGSESPAHRQGGYERMLPTIYQDSSPRPTDRPPHLGALPSLNR